MQELLTPRSLSVFTTRVVSPISDFAETLTEAPPYQGLNTFGQNTELFVNARLSTIFCTKNDLRKNARQNGIFAGRL